MYYLFMVQTKDDQTKNQTVKIVQNTGQIYYELGIDSELPYLYCW